MAQAASRFGRSVIRSIHDATHSFDITSDSSPFLFRHTRCCVARVILRCRSRFTAARTVCGLSQVASLSIPLTSRVQTRKRDPWLLPQKCRGDRSACVSQQLGSRLPHPTGASVSFRLLASSVSRSCASANVSPAAILLLMCRQ